MRIHGLCTTCRKIRLVTVNNSGMVKLVTQRVAEGICASCQEADDRNRGRKGGRR